MAVGNLPALHGGE